MFVTDGLGVFRSADDSIEPAAGIFALSLAGEGEPPFAEAVEEKALVERGEVADAFNADFGELFFGDFADTGNAFDFERREPVGFSAGKDPEDAVALCLIGGNLRDEAAG